VLSTDIQRVQLHAESQSEVEFDGRTLTLTRMEPITWVPWVDGELEVNAVYLARMRCDVSDDDVTQYINQWCHESGNAVIEVKVGGAGRALVHFGNRIGEHKQI